MRAQDNEATYLLALILRPATGARQLSITEVMNVVDNNMLIKGLPYGAGFGEYDDIKGYALRSFGHAAARKLLVEMSLPRMELQVHLCCGHLAIMKSCSASLLHDFASHVLVPSNAVCLHALSAFQQLCWLWKGHVRPARVSAPMTCRPCSAEPPPGEPAARQDHVHRPRLDSRQDGAVAR